MHMRTRPSSTLNVPLSSSLSWAVRWDGRHHAPSLPLCCHVEEEGQTPGWLSQSQEPWGGSGNWHWHPDSPGPISPGCKDSFTVKFKRLRSWDQGGTS